MEMPQDVEHDRLGILVFPSDDSMKRLYNSAYFHYTPPFDERVREQSLNKLRTKERDERPPHHGSIRHQHFSYDDSDLYNLSALLPPLDEPQPFTSALANHKGKHRRVEPWQKTINGGAIVLPDIAYDVRPWVTSVVVYEKAFGVPPQPRLTLPGVSPPAVSQPSLAVRSLHGFANVTPNVRPSAARPRRYDSFDMDREEESTYISVAKYMDAPPYRQQQSVFDGERQRSDVHWRTAADSETSSDERSGSPSNESFYSYVAVVGKYDEALSGYDDDGRSILQLFPSDEYARSSRSHSLPSSPTHMWRQPHLRHHEPSASLADTVQLRTTTSSSSEAAQVDRNVVAHVQTSGGATDHRLPIGHNPALVAELKQFHEGRTPVSTYKQQKRFQEHQNTEQVWGKIHTETQALRGRITPALFLDHVPLYDDMTGEPLSRERRLRMAQHLANRAIETEVARLREHYGARTTTSTMPPWKQELLRKRSTVRRH